MSVEGAMRVRVFVPAAIVASFAVGMGWKVGVARGRVATAIGAPVSVTPYDARIQANTRQMLDEGRQTFRFDTFGDEAYWTDELGLDRAIAGAKNGGVGAGVSPKTALSLGLKVDMDALPA